MKKAILAIALASCLAASGCASTASDSKNPIETAERFVSTANAMTAYTVVDSETGVVYLYVQRGYGGGVTPLLDADGNVVVDDRFRPGTA